MNSFLTLGAMFASSFTSATLLPGNSEIVLTAFLLAGQVSPWWLVLTAIVGNILGGLTNVIIGRLLPDVKPQRGTAVATLVTTLWRGYLAAQLGAYHW